MHIKFIHLFLHYFSTYAKKCWEVSIFVKSTQTFCGKADLQKVHCKAALLRHRLYHVELLNYTQP